MTKKIEVEEVYLKVRSRLAEAVSRVYGYGKNGQIRFATVEEGKCVRDVMSIFKKSIEGDEEKSSRSPRRARRQKKVVEAENGSGVA